VLTKELEPLLVAVRDGVAAAAVAKRVLKSRGTQERSFMVALTHTRGDWVEMGRQEMEGIIPSDYM
jgi:hypothetical protein